MTIKFLGANASNWDDRILVGTEMRTFSDAVVDWVDQEVWDEFNANQDEKELCVAEVKYRIHDSEDFQHVGDYHDRRDGLVHCRFAIDAVRQHREPGRAHPEKVVVHYEKAVNDKGDAERFGMFFATHDFVLVEQGDLFNFFLNSTDEIQKRAFFPIPSERKDKSKYCEHEAKIIKLGGSPYPPGDPRRGGEQTEPS